MLVPDNISDVSHNAYGKDLEKGDFVKVTPSGETKTEQSTAVKAVMFMLTGSISMNLMSTFIKLVDIHTSGGVSAWQTGLTRSLFMAALSLILCKYRGIDLWAMPKE